MEKIYKTIKQTALVLGFASVMQMQAQPTYCGSNATTTFDEEIYNFALNGAITPTLYSFTSGCSNAAPGAGSMLSRYSNFTSLGTFATVLMGQVSTFSIVQDECDGPTYYYCGIAIWIDYNQNGLFTDPGEQVFVENTTSPGPRTISGTFIAPVSATPGQTRLRIVCAEGYSGTSLTPCLNYGYGETEDYIVDLVPPPPCSGTPGSFAVTGPTAAICPGGFANLGMSGSYSVSGLTYQWQQSSTSAVGPWTNVTAGPTSATSGTFINFTTPTLNATTYYQVVVTCTNSTNSTANGAATINIQPVTISTVPYFEGFEGVTANNLMPNCSWVASSPTTVCRTYTAANTQNRIPRTGSKFASFNYLPAGTNAYYTNGIQLEPGITYSAALWYTTEYFGYTNWSDLSIYLCTSQNPAGVTSTIVSSNGPALSPVHKLLSNTFTVATSGIYYLGISATSNGACCGYNLSWDDLSVTIPCQINSPALGLSANSTTICAGSQVNLTASGANNYVWNTGATGSSISATPNSNITYMVTGTNTLTGCQASLSQMITVNPSPVVSIFSNKNAVCLGKTANLYAYGASSYQWSTGTGGPNVVVSPTATATYSVLGINQFGCNSTATIQLTTLPLPSINTAISGNQICLGESATLTANGASTYEWVSNNVFIQGATAVVTPNQSTSYVVTGTDANGCSNTANVTISVQGCVGLKEAVAGAGFVVYPNPNSGEFTIEFGNAANKQIEVLDITGRVVAKNTSNDQKVNFNLNTLANGVYYVKVVSNNSSEVVKIVKH